jgi:hypothetical protein
MQGLSHYSVIPDKSGSALFHFKLDSDSDVRIFLSPIVGSYKIYVSHNRDVTEDNYTWKGDDNSIIIYKEDKDFLRSATYFIFIKPSGIFIEDKQLSFSIKYSTEQSISLINEGIQENGEVKGKDYIYYKFIVLRKNLDLQVSLTTTSGDPKVIVSMSDTNIFPTINNKDMELT